MGSSNSKQIADNLTTSISQNIVNSISNVCQSTDYINSIKATCDAGAHGDCVKNCMKIAVNDAGINSGGELKDLCGSLCGCLIQDVNFEQIIIITSNTDQEQVLDQAIKSSVKTTLDQYKENSDADQTIDNSTKTITKNSAKILQSISSSNSAVQVMDIENTTIKGVSFKQTIDVVAKFLQKNDVTQKAINDIAVSMSQKDINTLNWVIYAGIIMVILFFLIFMIIMLTKSKDLKEFFYKILPVLIFIVVSSIITIIHVLTKPGYVSYTMEGEKDKRIDITKLLMYLFLYYIGLGIIIWGVWKVKKKYSGYSVGSDVGSGDVESDEY